MAFEQHLAREWNSLTRTGREAENSNGCFDCNICFEYAHDPVVTLCGHLYCWSCIYKWFHYQSASLASDEHPQCPVCKAEISHTTVVPLYGRGLSPTETDKGKTPYLGMVIPPRPQTFGTQDLARPSNSGQQLPYRNPYQNLHPDSNVYRGLSSQPGHYHSVVGMFGNLESLNANPNSYQLMGTSPPRLRRQEMQADKSLSRILFFLLCCFFMCLFLF